MKKLFLLILIGLTISCSTIKQSSAPLKEDEFLITRKFAGVYTDYRHTGFKDFSGTNLIWIKTSMESTFGKISAYGKKCKFSPGERLYLRRTYYTPGGILGYWTYYIENDNSVFYKVTDFQNDKKVLAETWFEEDAQDTSDTLK